MDHCLYNVFQMNIFLRIIRPTLHIILFHRVLFEHVTVSPAVQSEMKNKTGKEYRIEGKQCPLYMGI